MTPCSRKRSFCIRNGVRGRRRRFSVSRPGQQGELKSFEPGYLEGKDAGSIAIQAAEFAIAGRLVAGTTRGRFQRAPAGDTFTGFERAFDELPGEGVLALTSSTLGQDLRYDDDGFGFDTDGFAHYDIAVGNFELVAHATLELPARGSLRVRAADAVVIAGGIRTPGGTVEITVNGPRELASEPAQDSVGVIWLDESASIDSRR